MVQWLRRWILNPIFPGSNLYGDNVHSELAVLLMLRKCVGVVRIATTR